MKTLLKLPFKILALPFVPVLFLLSAATLFFGWLSGRVLAFVSLLLGVGGIVLLFQGDTYGGIGILVMAFLISPFGIPLFAEAIGNVLSSLTGAVVGFIAG